MAVSPQPAQIRAAPGFDTRDVELSGAPVDLVATLGEPTLPVELGDVRCVFIQNTGKTTVYWRSQAQAPASTSKGHMLAPGDSLAAYLFVGGRPFWVWSRLAGELTVSPYFGLPTREVYSY